MTKLKALVARFEKTKTAEQLFRVGRIVAVGVASAYVTHSAIDSVSITALVEAAFRQVFPVQVAPAAK